MPGVLNSSRYLVHRFTGALEIDGSVKAQPTTIHRMPPTSAVSSFSLQACTVITQVRSADTSTLPLSLSLPQLERIP